MTTKSAMSGATQKIDIKQAKPDWRKPDYRGPEAELLNAKRLQNREKPEDEKEALDFAQKTRKDFFQAVFEDVAAIRHSHPSRKS
jgi:hypothetical protein